MERIAADPEGYISELGGTEVNLDDDRSVQSLRALYEALQGEILSRLEELDEMKESTDFELSCAYEHDPAVLERIAQAQIASLIEEADALRVAETELAGQLEEIMGFRPD